MKIQFSLIYFLFTLFFLASCSDEEVPLPPEEQGPSVKVICECESDEDMVSGDGQNQSLAEKDAQENCSSFSPSITVRDCELVSE